MESGLNRYCELGSGPFLAGGCFGAACPGACCGGFCAMAMTVALAIIAAATVNANTCFMLNSLVVHFSVAAPFRRRCNLPLARKQAHACIKSIACLNQNAIVHLRPESPANAFPMAANCCRKASLILPSSPTGTSQVTAP